MTKLEAAIKEVQLRVKDYGDYFASYETRTKYALIDPILLALGWILGNPAQTQFEYIIPDTSKRADYALFKRDLVEDEPLILLEAKKFNPKGATLQGIVFSEKNWLWSLKVADEDQLSSYSGKLGLQAGYGVLTNGNEWRIYDLSKRGEFSEMILANLRVLNDPIAECAEKLSILRQDNSQWPGMPSQQLL